MLIFLHIFAPSCYNEKKYKITNMKTYIKYLQLSLLTAVFVAGLMILSPRAEASTLTLNSTITGETTRNDFSYSIATGDFNADGTTDLAVGAWSYNNYQGRVYIFYNDGSYATAAGSADVIITGENMGDRFGAGLTAGDLNYDGKIDLAVGADGYSSNKGRTYIFYNDGTVNFGTATCSGTPALCSAANADVIITGEANNNYFGYSLVTGDFNADTKTDLVVGANFYSSGKGRVYLFYNDGSYTSTAATADVIINESAGNYFGCSLAAGDFNADGNIDIAVGGNRYSSFTGKAYIFYNDGTVNFGTATCSGTPALCSAANADVIITGEASSNNFGISLAAGDFNADTKVDLAVGAENYSSYTGRAYIFYNDGSIPTTAATADVIITGDAGSFFGHSLAAGDFNADGTTDLAVGATSWSATDLGHIYIFYNDGSIPTTAATADVTFTGVAVRDYYGYSLAAGDINADGSTDLIVGADGYNNLGYTGRAYIYYQHATDATPTTLNIENVPPSFTSGPSDGPSSGTAPTNAGANVTFTAMAHDNNADQYYLAICKTGDAPTPGTDGPPTCNGGAGNNWAISAAANSDAPASVTYLTSPSNAESNAWYAFVCDKNTAGLCSAYSQGTLDAGSPFKVNHQPTMGTVKIGSECNSTASVNPGNDKSGTISTEVGGDGDWAYATVIQTDGKIVAAGAIHYGFDLGHTSFALARYNTNGSLDTSFGTNGKVVTTVGGTSGNNEANAVAIQSDGKIVAVGRKQGVGFAVVRYNSDGSLDTTFDSDGMVTTHMSFEDIAYSVAIQSDGKLVVAGTTWGSNMDIAVVRYNTDGSLDTTFDSDGKVSVAVGTGYDYGSSVALQSNGKIVVVGRSDMGGSNYDIAVVRFNTNGSLDTDFDSDGKINTSIGAGYDSGNSVVIQSDGKLVVGGYSDDYFAVVRYNSNGSLDTDFDSDGKVTTAIGVYDYINSIALQSNGKIVATGYTYDGSDDNFATVRYNTNGSLDTDFNGNGKVVTGIGWYDEAHAVSIQGNGKIVVVGESHSDYDNDFAVVRYNTNGSLDTDFGGDGIVTTGVASGTGYANSVALQPDGKIILAGGSNYDDFTLTRYNVDGSLDTTFDSDGILSADIGGGRMMQSQQDEAYSVAIQNDGKIVAVGYILEDGYKKFTVVRFNADGSLDTSFDSDGKVMTAIGSYNDVSKAVAIQSDGKIVVAGSSNNGSNDDFAIARYNTDGSLDTGFSSDGMVTTAIGTGNDVGNSVAIQTDGKIVVAGNSIIGSNWDFAIVRYNTDGSLDTSFDSDGKATTAVLSSHDYGNSVAIQTDGKIVVAGESDNGGNYDFAVVRYNTNGSLDTDFDTDGKVTTAVSTGYDSASSVAIQSDGKLVVGGYSDPSDFALVRYNTNGSLDTSFDTDGKVTTADGASYSMAIQPDGKIVLGGSIFDGFGFARYLSNGTVNNLTDYVCAQVAVTDTDTDTTADTIEMHVCSTNNFSGGACSDTTLCTATGVPSGKNAQCVVENEVPVPDAHGSYDVYVFIKDSHGFQGTGTSTQSYTVADVAPALVSYTATDAPAPSAGGSDTVDFSVSLTDDNGDNDVTNVKGIFFDDTTVNSDCSSNENNCYIHASCTKTGVSSPGTGKTALGTDNALGANCQVTVWFNMNASSNIEVAGIATDGNGDTSFTTSNTNITNPTLQGIDVTEGTIAYGTVVIGGTSAGQATSMGNVGNQTLDVYVSGTAMTAGSYSIAVGQQKWQHQSATFDWDDPATGAGPYGLVATPSGTGDAGGCLNRDIAVRTVHGTADTNESIFWKLRIPAGQQAGSYAGQNTFSTTSGGTCSTGASF